jgi:DNA modification methylase
MIQLINANSLHIPLADKSVHCVVTSPPYYGLRDYGVDGQLGLEETPEQYIAAMVAVFREVWRVLRDDGTLWVNIGDSYSTQSGKGNNVPQTKWTKNTYPENAPHRNRASNQTPGIKPKDLIGIPWMLAFALRADGWYLRSDCIWSKPNPMPESVTDRPTKAHEYLFLLSKRERYFYDSNAVREENAGSPPWGDKRNFKMNDERAQGRHGNGMFSGGTREEYIEKYYTNGRNRRTVWEELEDEFMQFLNWKAQQPGGLPDVFKIATAPTPYAHFATYPPTLVEPCIKAGTSERGVCPVCGAPWGRVTERTPMVLARSERTHEKGRTRSSGTMLEPPTSITTGWQPTCQHDAAPVPAIVLDPFAGSGTTGLVARSLGRNFIGLDLSLPYLRDIARERLGMIDLVEWTEGIKTEQNLFQDLPLFLEAS